MGRSTTFVGARAVSAPNRGRLARGLRTAVLLVVLALAAGCGGSGVSRADRENVCAGADGDGPRVGIAFSAPERVEGSADAAVYQGLVRAVKQFDASCLTESAAQGDGPREQEKRLRRLIEGGASVVIAVGGDYAEALGVVSVEYRDVAFAVLDGTGPLRQPNVAAVGFDPSEGAFLVGAVAALKSQTNMIGFLGVLDQDGAKSALAGYAAGAKAIKPGIRVIARYLSGGADRPVSRAAARQGARAEFGKGADIVYAVLADAETGVFEAAVEANGWAIGDGEDQYQTAPEAVRSHILTSMTKRYDTATYAVIEAVAKGAPWVGEVRLGLAEDGVGYARTGGFIDDIAEQIDRLAVRVVSGEVTVPGDPNQ